jgi:site-specific DNA recombinase
MDCDQQQAAPTTRRAVLYLRVSSRGQVETGHDSDGLSLPAQREACERKAEALDASVEECFVERGETATSTTKRQALQEMLQRLKQRDIDYVIVHKIDRLARNRADDVTIVSAIRAAGAQLVSVSENVDETPSGLLLHGIMSSIAEFYSRNLATEILKGSTQKAKQGGTPYRAPIGYLNSREWLADDGSTATEGVGREIRTVILDPVRAPLVRDAFTLYASGDYSLAELGAILEARGLRTRATRKVPEQPLGGNRLSSMLRNPYYLGIVTYAGQTYVGRHEPLIDEATFEQVQTVIKSQRGGGERSWKHDHYLSGTLYCATCGTRLTYSRSRGRNGTYYEYFVCQQRTPKACDQPNHRVELIEEAVEDYWATVTFGAERRERLHRVIVEQLSGLDAQRDGEIERASRALSDLKAQEKKLLQAHYADAISTDLFAEEQGRIRRERIAAESTQRQMEIESGRLEKGLDAALALTDRAQQSYIGLAAAGRRLMNQAIFERLEIDRESVSGAALNTPFREFCAYDAPEQGLKNKTDAPLLLRDVGSNFLGMVELAGLEPATSWVRSRHSGFEKTLD